MTSEDWELRIQRLANAIDRYTHEIELPAEPPPRYGAPLDGELRQWIAGVRFFRDLRLEWGAFMGVADYFAYIIGAPEWQRIAVLAMLKCAAHDVSYGGIGPFCVRQMAFQIEELIGPDEECWIDLLSLDELRFLLELFEIMKSIPPDDDDVYDERGFRRLGYPIECVHREIAKRS